MNTKSMLALKGAGDTGKTETLTLLIELLKSLDGVKCEKHKFKKESVAIFVINNIRIGISTSGDIESVLDKKVREFIVSDCNVIVCATRTFGVTVEAIKALAREYQYSLEWIDKSRADRNNKVEQFKKNKLDAEIIFNRITEIINNH
ncbi:hypothetical protein KKJ06_21555 [Xenorhabdus bovienii]|uniref:hypothetical protein n=1 Tax=Xenorhabdus bovienii TaxID=40576 RepID=UPI0023B251FA|nr:hypothetical protein [Xenorhabdus bovienii]MDE9557900.1 hypothetical protein [Xenorhabdus bovienii]